MNSKLNMICGLINDLKVDCYCQMDEIESKIPDPYMDPWFSLLEEIEEKLSDSVDSLRMAQKMIRDYETEYDTEVK